MPFTVVYDANVFYPAPLRDLLIRLAQTSLVRARWTEQILDECFDNLRRNRPDLDPLRLARTRMLINEAVRGCLITNYEHLINTLQLPDAKDRHVLAAAIRARARVIVTFNTNDFPRATTAAYGITAIHPDQFVIKLMDLREQVVRRVLEQQQAALGRPEPLDILGRLEQQGLPRTGSRLRDLAWPGLSPGRTPSRGQPPRASARPRSAGGGRRPPA